MDGWWCCWCSGSTLWPLVYNYYYYLLPWQLPHKINLFSKNVEILFYFILFPPNDKNLCKENIEFLRILNFSN